VEKKRDRRRRDERRMKARMRFIARVIHRLEPYEIDAPFVGRMASMHGTHYPCWMCGNARRSSGEASFSERRHAQSD
jgi:hypothetical protein